MYVIYQYNNKQGLLTVKSMERMEEKYTTHDTDDYAVVSKETRPSMNGT